MSQEKEMEAAKSAGVPAKGRDQSSAGSLGIDKEKADKLVAVHSKAFMLDVQGEAQGVEPRPGQVGIDTETLEKLVAKHLRLPFETKMVADHFMGEAQKESARYASALKEALETIKALRQDTAEVDFLLKHLRETGYLLTEEAGRLEDVVRKWERRDFEEGGATKAGK